MNWTTQSAVVTGATKGIGRAITEALASRGARVGAIARSESDLDRLATSPGAHGRVEVAAADVGSRDSLHSAIATLAARLGEIDILVNNAGIGLYGPVGELDPDMAEKLMRVNYLGTLYGTQAVLPGMLARRSGHIVNVASIAGRIGAPFEAAYAASKFAVVGFTEALAVEVGHFGIKVSMVNPGPVETGFFDARGHPYERRRPKPVPAGAVADAVIEVVETGRLERSVPRSLGRAVALRHLSPRLFAVGTRVAFRKELRRYHRGLGVPMP